MEMSVTEAAKARTRLILVTPVVDDAVVFAPRIEQACRAGDVAAVILKLAEMDAGAALSAIRIVSSHIEPFGAALLLDGRPELVSAAGADGAHFSNLEQLKTDRPKLASGRLCGVGGLATRHDAMVASESGVDYVMFGEPGDNEKRPGFSALVERVAWWAEIFQLPCVAYAGALDEVEKLSAANADFVALGDALWNASGNAANVITQATEKLKLQKVA
jgi:thiamine-phosphate pyrophosphorylase